MIMSKLRPSWLIAYPLEHGCLSRSDEPHIVAAIHACLPSFAMRLPAEDEFQD